MKKLNQMVLFIMMISLVAFSACSSDDDGGSNGDEFLRATIDGADFSAAQNPTVIVGAQSTSGVLAIQGGDNNGNTISMAINGYNGVGTYVTGDAITNTNFIQYLTISGTTPSTWASGLASASLGTLMSGSIEVTSDDGTTVEGTFTFEGYNASDMSTKVVTNGEFKAEFD